jgi:hypothetical protein
VGHWDLQGLCRALVDWGAELRLLQATQMLPPVAPQLAHVRSSGAGLACGQGCRDEHPRAASGATRSKKCPPAVEAGRAGGEE